MKKIIMIIMILIICFSSICYSVNPDKISVIDLNNKVSGIGTKVIGVFKIVGTIVAIAILVFVGVKFMLAAPGAKADLKSSFVPYIVGAVLIFSAAQIADIIYKLVA